MEHIYGTAARHFAGFHIYKLPSRHVHRDQRIEVCVSLRGNGARFLLGNGRLLGKRRRHGNGKGRRQQSFHVFLEHGAILNKLDQIM